MSFWKKIFGSGGSEAAAGDTAEMAREEYKGFVIRAALQRAGNEYQLAGSIEKEIEGEVKRHDFVRADRFSSRDDAASFTLAKGRQIVDEQGEGLFKQTWPSQPN
ncbi:MAG TPA: HlyU family transcriptional regulator [Devosiaceae bacterium]|jgi:hypothetical protein|nr:HlyU family transcriptional regulator [Devosiaceae bacterium]